MRDDPVDVRIRAVTREDNAAVAALIHDTRREHLYIIGDEAALLEPEEHDVCALYAARTASTS